MRLTGRRVNRGLSRLIYLLLLFMAFWAGRSMINYTLDARFYHNFLLKWELALQRQNTGQAAWPDFSGANHLHYMHELIGRMQRNDFRPPASNTGVPFIYRLHNLAGRSERIFLLALADRIVLYRLPEQTFQRLDGFIDKGDGPLRGAFTGQPSSDTTTYTGQWRL
jgi:hypothetical protein